MHAYLLGRLWRLPWLDTPLAHRILVLGLALLWLAYPLARVLERRGSTAIAHPIEWLGAAWLGALFLLVACLLIADLLTGFGWWAPRLAPTARTLAVIGGLGLSVIALVQGTRPPKVEEVTIVSPKLPATHDGLRLVQISDLHVGALLNSHWLQHVAAQVGALAPDAVLITGDLVDGNARRVAEVLPELRAFTAPLGVWAVSGNHEYYAGLELSVDVLRQAGFRVLRDESAELCPGVVVAGVDDLTARRQFGDTSDPFPNALADRPVGFTVFLSHTPWRAEEAAAMGVDVMLSGHTHAGQIWPFGYLTGLQYPYLEGRYAVGEMTLYVSRGTGTWGPRMRLPRPAEITVVTLRSDSSRR